VHTEFWWGNLRERDHLEDPGISVRVLKWISKKWDGGHRQGCSGSELGQVVGSCECSNEPLGTLKYEEFLD